MNTTDKKSWRFSSPVESLDTGFAIFQTLDNGSSRYLDFRIVGTDGCAIFSSDINQQLLPQYKYRKNKESDEDWCKVLRFILLGEKEPSDSLNKKETDISTDEVYDNLNITGKYDPRAQRLILTIRRKLNLINETASGEAGSEFLYSKLGEISFIELPEDTEIELDLVQWVRDFDIERQKWQERESVMTRQIKIQQDMIEELKLQFEYLLSAKQEFENDIYEKVAIIINEHKGFLPSKGIRKRDTPTVEDNDESKSSTIIFKKTNDAHDEIKIKMEKSDLNGSFEISDDTRELIDDLNELPSPPPMKDEPDSPDQWEGPGNQSSNSGINNPELSQGEETTDDENTDDND